MYTYMYKLYIYICICIWIYRYGLDDMKSLCESMLATTRTNWLDLLHASELVHSHRYVWQPYTIIICFGQMDIELASYVLHFRRALFTIKLLHECFQCLCSSLMPYWTSLCVLRLYASKSVHSHRFYYTCSILLFVWLFFFTYALLAIVYVSHVEGRFFSAPRL
jgi:hypothetical protein